MSTLWRIVPRDPVVAGDGRGQPALASRLPNPLPPQPTVAGFVRTAFTGSGRVSRAEAISALQRISLRGPFLETRPEGGPATIWVHAPADAARGEGGALVRGALIRCAPEEGVSWTGEALDLLMHLPSKDAIGRKLRSPVRPARWPSGTPALWPLGAAVAWAGQQDDEAARLLAQVAPEPPLQAEPRVHVALDPQTGTAARSLLFSSAGWRYAEGAGLLVEVDAPADQSPTPGGVLGAEGRPARITVETGMLPGFDAKDWRGRWMDLAARSPGRLALRVQLLTAGCFGGWAPNRPDLPPLLAAALGPHQALSGWSLAARAPRAIRRLAPAGSVYIYGPVTDLDTFLSLAESLWLQPLSQGQADLDHHLLAAPGRDGYGLALPGLAVLPE